MAEKYQFETRCIHGDGGFVEEHPYGAVSVPIFQTATFAHPGIGKSTGYDYSRESNPTRYELESVMSSLEGAVLRVRQEWRQSESAWSFLEQTIIFYVQKICTAELCECLKALAKSED